MTVKHVSTERQMIERRNLLRWALAGSAGLALPLAALRGEGSPGAPGDGEAWLDAIAKKKFRAFLDIRSFHPGGQPYAKVTNLMAALTRSHGADASEVGIAFGASGDGLAHVIGPDFWEEYQVGSYIAPNGRADDAAAVRANPRKWGDLAGEGVRQLRSSDVRVLACRNTIARWSRDLSAKSGETPAAVVAKIEKGLHAGVEPVPAMIAAAVLAQLRDVPYVTIG